MAQSRQGEPQQAPLRCKWAGGLRVSRHGSAGGDICSDASPWIWRSVAPEAQARRCAGHPPPDEPSIRQRGPGHGTGVELLKRLEATLQRADARFRAVPGMAHCCSDAVNAIQPTPSSPGMPVSRLPTPLPAAGDSAWLCVHRSRPPERPWTGHLRSSRPPTRPPCPAANRRQLCRCCCSPSRCSRPGCAAGWRPAIGAGG